MINVMLAVDSPQIRQTYQSLPWTQAKIDEKNNQFYITELEQCMAKLLPQQSNTVTETKENTNPPQFELLPGQIRFFDVARTGKELLELTTESITTFEI